MAYFLDACALIAFLRDEDGAEAVEDRILQGGCRVHAINVYELYKDTLGRDGDLAAADELLSDVAALVERNEDLDDGTIREAAMLRRGFRMSMADAIGVTAAAMNGMKFLSADHKELDPPAAAGHPIEFFR